MNKRSVRFLVGSFLVVALSGTASAIPLDSATSTVRSRTPTGTAPAGRRIGALSVPFQANTGQDDRRVAYTARTLGGTLFVTRDGQLVHSFPGKEIAGKERGFDHKTRAPLRGRGWTLTETLINARPRPQNGPASATRVSRFVGGDPKRWRNDVPTFERVSLGEAWPGITVELSAHGRNVEKLFTLAPGADPRRIGIRLRGAERLEIAADGALVAHTGNGPVAFSAPVAWQDIDGKRRPVAVKYALAGTRYGFTLGTHDRRHAVVIDPVTAFTYLGGGSNDFMWGLVPDTDGNLYVAGYTNSTDFPGTAGGSQPVAPSGGGNPDAVVAKLDAELNLLQATFFGSAGADLGFAIERDSAGHIFVAGFTESNNLPGIAGGAQPGYAGGFDGFVAKFSADLKTLMQTTYVGGSGFDQIRAMAVDGNDNVFVAGTTNSTIFPGTAGGAQAVYGGAPNDAFVVKLSNDLRTRMQASFVGGSASEQGNSIAINPAGDVYLTGVTGSANFPATAGAAQTTLGGGVDAFVVRLGNNLMTMPAATYLGGSGNDVGFGIAVGPAGNVHVAGGTGSTDFPWTAGGAQTTNAGGTDAFIATFDADLTPPGRATYIGGSGEDEAHAVAVNPLTGAVAIAGNTTSSDLPVTPGSEASPLRAGIEGSRYRTASAGAAASPAKASNPKDLESIGSLIAEASKILDDIYFLEKIGAPFELREAWYLKWKIFLRERVGAIDVRKRDEAIDEEIYELIYGGSQMTMGSGALDSGATGAEAKWLAIAGTQAKAAPKRQEANAGGFDGHLARLLIPNHQGLWWNAPEGSESGWGINLAHQGNTIFATWFTYDLDGKPWWLAVVATQVAPGVYTGELFTTTGPPFNSVPFDSANVVETPIGTATFTFTGANSATFAYTVNVNTALKAAVTQTKTITRQEFGALPTCTWGTRPKLNLASNYLDLWWNVPPGSESGWGINFTHQGDKIFATWFTYDLDGKPWWLAFTADLTAPGVYTGDIFTTAGPPFNAVPFNPATVVETTIGTATLTFIDGETATFAYTVNGISQTKTITRQLFSAANTACG